jgi:hypothetical protein
VTTCYGGQNSKVCEGASQQHQSTSAGSSHQQQSSTSAADFSFEVNTSMDTTVSFDCCKITYDSLQVSEKEEQNDEEIAVSYVIFDQNRMVIGANGKPDLWTGLLYIGQTRDPAHRHSKHQAAGRLDGTAQMYIVNKYKGFFLF